MRRFTSLFPGMQGNGSIAEADESWRSRPPGLAPKSATTPPLWDFASQGTSADLREGFRGTPASTEFGQL